MLASSEYLGALSFTRGYRADLLIDARPVLSASNIEGCLLLAGAGLQCAVLVPEIPTIALKIPSEAMVIRNSHTLYSFARWSRHI